MAVMLPTALYTPHGWHAALRIVRMHQPPHYFVVLSALGCRIPPD
jgi:hypothetical protein